MLDILGFALLATFLLVVLAHLGGPDQEPVRVRKLKEELDRIGYHPMG